MGVGWGWGAFSGSNGILAEFCPECLLRDREANKNRDRDRHTEKNRERETHTHTHARTRTHAHAHTRTHTHTHTHTHRGDRGGKGDRFIQTREKARSPSFGLFFFLFFLSFSFFFCNHWWGHVNMKKHSNCNVNKEKNIQIVMLTKKIHSNFQCWEEGGGVISRHGSLGKC